MVRPAGFEPAAFGSGGQRSIQLSYGRLALEIAESGATGNRAGKRKKRCNTGLFDAFLWLSPVPQGFSVA